MLPLKIDLISRKNILWSLALILTLSAAFGIRQNYILPREFAYDEALYAWQADRLGENPALIFSEEMTDYHPPLFPAMLAGGRAVFGLSASLASYSFLVTLLGLFGIWGLLILGAQVSSRFLGLFCACCLAFNVPHIYSSVHVFNDILFASLTVFLLWALWRAQRYGHKREDIAVGIITALMLGVKYTALLFIPLIAAFYMMLAPVLGRRKCLARLSVPSLIIASTLAALAVNNHLTRGTIFPIISALDPAQPGFAHAGRVFRYYLTSHQYPTVLFIPAAIWAVTIAIRARDPFARSLVIFIATGIVSLFYLKKHDYRYGLFILPAYFLLAGIGLEDIIKKVCRHPPWTFLAKIGVLSAVIIWNASIVYFSDTNFRDTLAMPPDHSNAAAWVKEHATPDTTIISQEPRLMRYYTRINLAEYGGAIIRMPDTEQGVRELLDGLDGHVLLEVNSCRDLGKTNFRPFTEPRKWEAILGTYGYFLKKTTYHPTHCGRGSRSKGPYPAVKIFERGVSNPGPD